MKHLKFLVKINNVIGYVLIATIVLSPIGFIQVLLGNLVLMIIDEKIPDLPISRVPLK